MPRAKKEKVEQVAPEDSAGRPPSPIIEVTEAAAAWLSVLFNRQNYQQNGEPVNLLVSDGFLKVDGENPLGDAAGFVEPTAEGTEPAGDETKEPAENGDSANEGGEGNAEA